MQEPACVYNVRVFLLPGRSLCCSTVSSLGTTLKARCRALGNNTDKSNQNR